MKMLFSLDIVLLNPNSTHCRRRGCFNSMHNPLEGSFPQHADMFSEF